MRRRWSSSASSSSGSCASPTTPMNCCKGLDKLPGWPEKVRTMQRNWIGRSEGTLVDFKLDGPAGPVGDKITVFTTRVDTIFGATSLQLAPEHPMVADLVAINPDLLGEGRRPEERAAEGEGGWRHRRHRKARCFHRTLRHQSVQRRARAHLGGELRAARLRHRCHHVRASARRARLRICQEVRTRHPRSHSASSRRRRSRWRTERAGIAVHRDATAC